MLYVLYVRYADILRRPYLPRMMHRLQFFR
jgi:hypothetical protein